jgi:hypothetical protein
VIAPGYAIAAAGGAGILVALALTKALRPSPVPSTEGRT